MRSVVARTSRVDSVGPRSVAPSHMRLPSDIWTRVGEYALAADLARLVVTRAHRGAVATAVAIALRRPGGTTRDLYLLERAASSRLATSRGEVFFATRDGELVQFDDENWEFTRNWSKLGNSRVLCVSMGVDFGIAVTDQGSVFTWGSNEHGQLGQELVPGGFRREPTRSCETLSDVASVAAGVDYAWCVTRKGEAYSWGACADFPLPSNHEVFVRHGTRYVTTPVRAEVCFGLRGLRCEYIVMRRRDLSGEWRQLRRRAWAWRSCASWGPIPSTGTGWRANHQDVHYNDERYRVTHASFDIFWQNVRLRL